MTNIVKLFAASVATLAVSATPAMAQEVIDVAQLDLADTGDTAWMVTATIFGLLALLPGLALWQSARVHRKNSMTVLATALGVVALVSLLWVIVGYTLAFGGVTGGWLGAGNAWMLQYLGNIREGLTVPESAYAFFQLVPALLAVLLITGAIAERARFGWTMAYCGLWTLIVYAPVAHWVWGGGWLGDSGLVDYGGGVVVLTAAGVSALIAAVLVGRRSDMVIAQHPKPAGIAGFLMLWAGWIALSGGLALAANDDAASAMINTHLAASVAALVWLALDRWRLGKVSIHGLGCGGAAGLATILPAAGYVSPGGAIIMGLVGALVARFALKFIRNTLKIDDALHVFALFGITGMAGTMLLGLFGNAALGGVLAETGIAGQMGTQALGVTVVALWSAFASTIIGLGVSMGLPMRVSEADEEAGLDMGLGG